MESIIRIDRRHEIVTVGLSAGDENHFPAASEDVRQSIGR